MNKIFEDFQKLKNEDFAIKCIELLIENNKLDSDTLNCLTDGKWCKDMGFMRRNKSILKEIPSNCDNEELKKQMLDNTASNRYYKHIIKINNAKYIITNYWYGPDTNHPDNRTPFLNWVMNMLDWNGNGKIDPIDMGVYVATENATKEEKPKADNNKANAGCLTTIITVVCVVATIISLIF